MGSRVVVIFFLLLGIVGVAFPAAESVLEYPVSGKQYAIVVVRENNLSREEAKKIAYERAHQVTKEQGYRSFSVISEQDTQVVRSPKNGNQYQNYGNMYQELIMEGDFNRNRLANDATPNAGAFPAYRLVIRFNT